MGFEDQLINLQKIKDKIIHEKINTWFLPFLFLVLLLGM